MTLIVVQFACALRNMLELHTVIVVAVFSRARSHLNKMSQQQPVWCRVLSPACCEHLCECVWIWSGFRAPRPSSRSTTQCNQALKGTLFAVQPFDFGFVSMYLFCITCQLFSSLHWFCGRCSLFCLPGSLYWLHVIKATHRLKKETTTWDYL